MAYRRSPHPNGYHVTGLVLHHSGFNFCQVQKSIVDFTMFFSHVVFCERQYLSHGSHFDEAIADITQVFEHIYIHIKT